MKSLSDDFMTLEVTELIDTHLKESALFGVMLLHHLVVAREYLEPTGKFTLGSIGFSITGNELDEGLFSLCGLTSKEVDRGV